MSTKNPPWRCLLFWRCSSRPPTPPRPPTLPTRTSGGVHRLRVALLLGLALIACSGCERTTKRTYAGRYSSHGKDHSISGVLGASAATTSPYAIGTAARDARCRTTEYARPVAARGPHPGAHGTPDHDFGLRTAVGRCGRNAIVGARFGSAAVLRSHVQHFSAPRRKERQGVEGIRSSSHQVAAAGRGKPAQAPSSSSSSHVESVSSPSTVVPGFPSTRLAASNICRTARRLHEGFSNVRFAPLQRFGRIACAPSVAT